MANFLTTLTGSMRQRLIHEADPVDPAGAVDAYLPQVAATLVSIDGAALAGITTVTATIANGESLSDEVDCGADRYIVGIIMPQVWTAAAMTFQAGVATGMVANVYDQFGAELSYTVDAARYIPVGDLPTFYGARFVHLRSGTAAAAVAQGAEREITLVLAAR